MKKYFNPYQTNKSMNVKLLVLLFTVATFTFCTQAQDHEMDPETTELWEPIPPVVQPDENAPPSDAVVLFDGDNLNEWETGPGFFMHSGLVEGYIDELLSDGEPADWDLKGDHMTVKPEAGNIKTKQRFGSVQLHVEWKTPSEVLKEGQDRGNSGIFLMGLYEIQVLDSYQHQTYSNGQAGSIYKQHAPLVNASLPPGEWQTYDIFFQAPQFSEQGTLIAPAYVTVVHNGVLVQHHTAIWGPTVYLGIARYIPHPDKMPLVLQDHSELVSYRNIWIREL